MTEAKGSGAETNVLLERFAAVPNVPLASVAAEPNVPLASVAAVPNVLLASFAKRVRARWLHRVPGRERLVLLAGLAVRLAAIAMIAYSLPLVWGHLPHAGLSLLLATGLAVESLVVVGWWAAEHRLVRASLWVDLPCAALALVAGSALIDPDVVFGWTLFVYPYSLLVSIGYGLACRTVAGAVCCGVLCSAASIAGLVAFGEVRLGLLLAFVPSYLIHPCVGWACARLLRRASDDLEAARLAAVRETADLVTAAQRARLSTALHDRVLQTLETLGRGDGLGDEALRERVRNQAAWLRRYVETGRVNQSDDLTVGLEAAARAAQHDGLAVEVNDARLRDLDPGGGLTAEQRDALVDSTYQTISALGSGDGEIVVWAAPDHDGILVTVLSSGRGMPNIEDIADARSRLAAVGGRLSLEPVPYAELWVPQQGHPAAGFVGSSWSEGTHSSR